MDVSSPASPERARAGCFPASSATKREGKEDIRDQRTRGLRPGVRAPGVRCACRAGARSIPVVPGASRFRRCGGDAPMTGLVDGILNVPPVVAYVIVTCLVFAEDASFVGFVLPGETAAVVGGVVASRGNVQLWLMMVLVVLAATIGDSVGYEVGKHLGPRFLDLRVLRKRRKKLEEAQDFLRNKGGAAVFLGRLVAFFRAVMPALAGTARMPYLRFLAFNVAGGWSGVRALSCWGFWPAIPMRRSRKRPGAISPSSWERRR